MVHSSDHLKDAETAIHDAYGHMMAALHKHYTSDMIDLIRDMSHEAAISLLVHFGYEPQDKDDFGSTIDDISQTLLVLLIMRNSEMHDKIMQMTQGPHL